MAKPVTQSFIDILQTKTGTEPIFLLGINFGTGINWFASKRVYGFDASIISIGSCSCERRADSEGTTGTVSITLSDYNGFAKLMQDRVQLEKAGATLSVAFEDQPRESAFVVLSGQVVGPVEWSEGDRTLSFNLETVIDSQEAGFAAIDEFPDLAPEAKNVAWPMMFGSPAHVPALRVRKRTEGRLICPIRLNSNLYKFPPPVGNGPQVIVMDEECHVLTNFNGDEKDVIYIENGEKFPQAQEVEIVIDKVCFKGTFNGTRFTCTKANTPYYTDVTIYPDPTATEIQLQERMHAIVHLDEFHGNLSGMHCYFDRETFGPLIGQAAHYRFYNQCEKQEKATLKFSRTNYELVGSDVPVIFQTKFKKTQKIVRAYSILPNGLNNAYAASHEYVIAVEQYNLIPWTFFDAAQKKTNQVRLSGMMKDTQDLIDNPNKLFWNAAAGSVVRLKITDPEIYIASGVPLTSVDAVVGKKSVTLLDGRTFKAFEPIPSDYYTVQLKSNYRVGGDPNNPSDGDFATAILFDEPLKDKIEEGWDDEVFVTGTSSVGPNPAEIIRYLINTYVPGLAIGHFDAVSESANFAIFEKKNALEFAREIAWQSRCALRIDGPKADLINLDSGSHIPVLTVDEDMVKAGTIRVGNTDVNQIKTKLIARWRPDYRHLPMPIAQLTHTYDLVRVIGELTKDVDRKENFYVYRENIAKYGERSETKDFYIFNEEDPVARGATFWGHRYANSWRTVRFETFLIGAFVQAFDWVGLAVSGFEMSGYDGLAGETQRMTLNPAEKTVELALQLNVEAGN